MGVMYARLYRHCTYARINIDKGWAMRAIMMMATLIPPRLSMPALVAIAVLAVNVSTLNIHVSRDATIHMTIPIETSANSDQSFGGAVCIGLEVLAQESR